MSNINTRPATADEIALAKDTNNRDTKCYCPDILWPSGMRFAGRCTFGDACTFSYGSRFGHHNALSAMCLFCVGCNCVGDNTFGVMRRFDRNCSFLYESSFGHHYSITDCTFGRNCEFDKNCNFIWCNIGAFENNFARIHYMEADFAGLKKTATELLQSI